MSGRWERKLVNLLWDQGIGAVRIPTSGSATDRPLPDVLAGQRVGRECIPWAIEHKSTSSTCAYVDAGEVEALREFADAFGAVPYLGVRFTSQASPTAHFLVRPEDARMTDGGAFGLPLSSIDERASVVIE